MVDIHSHVLYGLDDGAQTIEQTLEMLRMAAATGTTDIVGTPHANSEFAFQPDLIRERLAEVTAATGGSIRVYTGCDFHLQYENIQDAIQHPTKYTVNHKTYLLVEFSDLLIFNSTGQIFAQLRAAGMLPIVTHPERNGLLQQRVEQLQGWILEGCYVQVTAQSLLGRFGRRASDTAEKLMRRGLVHFVASDAHDPEDRTPDLRPAYDYVAEKYGPERAEMLFVINPRAALVGDPIDTMPFEAISEPRKWFQFWK
jgi:protein-tyrosine phosphatase